jgi:hypothetical protein
MSHGIITAASASSSPVPAPAVIRLGEYDEYNQKNDRNQLFHRVLEAQEQLSSPANLIGGEYIMVHETTGELLHYEPPFTKATTGFPGMLDKNGQFVLGIFCFFHQQNNVHGVPHGKYFGRNCFKNNQLHGSLGIVADHFQKNKLPKGRKFLEVLHGSVYPASPGLTKNKFISAYVENGNWTLCITRSEIKDTDNNDKPENTAPNISKAADTNVYQDITRFCNLLKVILRDGSDISSNFNSILREEITWLLVWIEENKPSSIEVLIKDHGFNTKICVILHQLDLVFSTTDFRRLIEEISHWEAEFISNNYLLSGAYDLVNITCEVEIALQSRYSQIFVSFLR